MKTNLIHCVGPSDEESKNAAIIEFSSAVKTAARESEAAVAEAKPALARIASAIVGRDHGQALRVRAVLVSLHEDIAD